MKSMDFKEKQEEKDRNYKKAILKNHNDKRYLLTLDLKSVRSLVKGKYSICKELESQSLRGKKMWT